MQITTDSQSTIRVSRNLMATSKQLRSLPQVTKTIPTPAHSSTNKLRLSTLMAGKYRRAQLRKKHLQNRFHQCYSKMNSKTIPCLSFRPQITSKAMIRHLKPTTKLTQLFQTSKTIPKLRESHIWNYCFKKQTASPESERWICSSNRSEEK